MKAGRRSRSILLGLILALASSLIVVLPAAPAYAACYGATCNGLDPVAQGCFGRSIVPNTEKWGSREDYGMYMIHSSGCSSRWTRMNITSCPTVQCLDGRIAITRQRWSQQEGWYNAQFYHKAFSFMASNVQINTPMVPDLAVQERYIACYRFEGTEGSSYVGSWECGRGDNGDGWVYDPPQ
ncbi:hypothetical protein [Nonomuraea sp. NPDC049480]|uniref:hypothetical protein n=1 Tax=Nonomuraea sp. NPDC049480 TaxID=3364353 RepID=UPI003797FBB9